MNVGSNHSIRSQTYPLKILLNPKQIVFSPLTWHTIWSKVMTFFQKLSYPHVCTRSFCFIVFIQCRAKIGLRFQILKVPTFPKNCESLECIQKNWNFFLEHFLCQNFRHVKQNSFGELKFELVSRAPIQFVHEDMLVTR